MWDPPTPVINNQKRSGAKNQWGAKKNLNLQKGGMGGAAGGIGGGYGGVRPAGGAGGRDNIS